MFRSILTKLITWAFSKCLTIIRLNPGDIIVCYDYNLSCQLADTLNRDIIDGSCEKGSEHLLFTKFTFKELTSIYNEAYKRHAEGIWKKATTLAQLPLALTQIQVIPSNGSMITKSSLDGQEAGPGQTVND